MGLLRTIFTKTIQKNAEMQIILKIHTFLINFIFALHINNIAQDIISNIFNIFLKKKLFWF